MEDQLQKNGELVVKDLGKLNIKVPSDVSNVTVEEDGTVIAYKGKDKVELGKIK